MNLTHLLFLSFLFISSYSHSMLPDDNYSFEKIKEILKTQNIDLNSYTMREEIKIEEPTWNISVLLNRRKGNQRLIYKERPVELKDIIPAVSRGLIIGISESLVEHSINFCYNIVAHNINTSSDTQIENLTTTYIGANGASQDYTDMDVLSHTISYFTTFYFIPSILTGPFANMFTSGARISLISPSSYSHLGLLTNGVVSNVNDALLNFTQKRCGGLDKNPLTNCVLRNEALRKSPGVHLENIEPSMANGLQCAEILEHCKPHRFNPSRLYNYVTGSIFSLVNSTLNYGLNKAVPKTSFIPKVCKNCLQFYKGALVKNLLETQVLPSMEEAKEKAKDAILKSVIKNINANLDFQNVEEFAKAEGHRIGYGLVKDFFSEVAKENKVDIDLFISKPILAKESEKTVVRYTNNFIKVSNKVAKPFLHIKNCINGTETKMRTEVIDNDYPGPVGNLAESFSEGFEREVPQGIRDGVDEAIDSGDFPKVIKLVIDDYLKRCSNDDNSCLCFPLDWDLISQQPWADNVLDLRALVLQLPEGTRNQGLQALRLGDFPKLTKLIVDGIINSDHESEDSLISLNSTGHTGVVWKLVMIPVLGMTFWLLWTCISL